MYNKSIEEIKKIELDDEVFNKIKLDLISSLENSSKGDEIIERIDNRIHWLNEHFFNNSFRSIIFPPVSEVVDLMNDFNSYIKLDEGKQILIETIKKILSEINPLTERYEKEIEELRLDFNKLVGEFNEQTKRVTVAEKDIEVISKVAKENKSKEEDTKEIEVVEEDDNKETEETEKEEPKEETEEPKEMEVAEEDEEKIEL